MTTPSDSQVNGGATSTTTVGFLHPGAMGSAMATACLERTLWIRAGRSAATAQRASTAGMSGVASMTELADAADVIVSICPPHAALDVAAQVAAVSFDGVYVDANAVSPATARSVAKLVNRFVDAAVIGPPPVQPGRSRLYLSGDDAPQIASLWEGSALQPIVLTTDQTAASALKMAYASWTKGSAALLLSSLALAEANGVGPDLLAEWEISQQDLPQRAIRTANTIGPKGWRFVGEMTEIAQAMSSSDLPDGFHRAAADLYERLAELRDHDSPSLDLVVDLLGRRQLTETITQTDQ